MRLRPIVDVLLLLFVTVGAAAQQPAPPQPQPPPQGQPQEQPQEQQPRPPVIRRGINFIRVDVIVTDKDGKPVLDLKPEEFQVVEEGAPQQIETFQVINVGSEPVQTATPIRNEADIEREAQREDVRVIAILLDDYHVRRGAGMGVRDPLERFLQQQIAPTDLVGIMYPLTPVTDFVLTRNHDALVTAVRKFEGRKYDYNPRNEFEERYAYYPAAVVERIRNEVTLTALRALVTHLGGVREGRKAVILVSEGFTNSLPPQLNDPIAALPGLGNPNRGNATIDPGQSSQEFFREIDILTELREVYAAANRSNTAIYTLDPRGLSAFEYDIDEGVGANFDRRIGQQTRDTLIVLANETDGRAIVNRNDLDSGLRQVVRDSSGYYLIGYNSTQSPTDGKFHEIRVRVKRPGVQVRARKGYWAYTAEDAARATDAASARPANTVPPEVEQALASMAAPRGRRARTWVGTSRAEGGKTLVTFSWEPMAATAGPGSIAGPDPEQVSLTALAPSGQPYFRGRVPARTSVSFEAAPGPLQLRYNIETGEGRLVDSDTRELSVPDYSAPEVRLSTPRVFRGRTPRDMQAARTNPTAAPTAAREFSRAERLLIRLSAYGPGDQPPALTAKLLNRAGKAMADIPVKPLADSPGGFEVELPLASLAHGDYLIELTATPAGDGGGSGAKELVAIRVTS
jgi:VWFA-related protein